MKKKIKREIQISENLQGNPNIITRADIVKTLCHERPRLGL